MIDVKQATTSDVEEMAKVVVATWKSAYKGIVSQSFLQKLNSNLYVERFKRYIASKKSGLFYAKQDNKIVGVLQANEDDSANKVHIHLLYILPSAQNQGVGKALLKSCFEQFHQYDCFELDVLVGNDKAQSFYMAQGFQFTGEKRKTEINGGVCYVERARFQK